MPHSYKTKVIVVGTANSEKDVFFKCHNNLFNSCCNTSYWTIGLSIKIAEYIDLGRDLNLTIAFWDINPSERFQFLFPNFFRGATGAIIFLDYVNNNLFKELNFWINNIRENSYNIPIFLVGFDKQIKNRATTIKILNYIKKNHLENFYFLLTPERNNNSFILNQLSKRILNHIQLTHGIFGSGNVIHQELILEFNQFIKFFSNCPVCGIENHKNYLSKFYFDNSSSNKILKDYLINIMKKYEGLEHLYENNIKIGIPCCACFNKIFLSKNLELGN